MNLIYLNSRLSASSSLVFKTIMKNDYQKQFVLVGYNKIYYAKLILLNNS